MTWKDSTWLWPEDHSFTSSSLLSVKSMLSLSFLDGRIFINLIELNFRIYIYTYIFCFIAFSSWSVCLCCMTRLIALYFWDNGVTYCLFSYFVCFVILNWSCRGVSLIRRFETILWTCSFQVLLRLRMLWNDKPKPKKYQKRKLFSFLTPNSNLTNAQRLEKDRIGARSLQGEIGSRDVCVSVCERGSSSPAWKPNRNTTVKPTFARRVGQTVFDYVFLDAYKNADKRET